MLQQQQLKITQHIHLHDICPNVDINTNQNKHYSPAKINADIEINLSRM